MPTRRERNRIATRDEIIATAWEQIAETGAAALSLRAIARQMGLTAPALYRYFKDRNALVTALVIDAFNSFSASLEAARDACPVDDHAGRFRSISLAYFRWGVANLQRYLLIFGTHVPSYEIDEDAGPAAQHAFLVLEGVIGEAYQAGKIHLSPEAEALPSALAARLELLHQMGVPYAPVVTELALASWSKIHGMTALFLYGYLPSFLSDQAEAFIRFEIEKYMHTLGLE